mmetsp:Transcript_22348/g.51204  ORF Transcript_22348/g.51204 Transcript_22348/m.51204 type:complete len:381 (-) Transcript_22348:252-1394(-)
MVQEHSLFLNDGRILAYHTFPEFEQEDAAADATDAAASDFSCSRHPVLYFHGFPGCGLEAKLTCAKEIAEKGGRVYAIDRPGMGKTSSPYPQSNTSNSSSKDNTETKENNQDQEINLQLFVRNVWELVQDLQWTEFSVVGVSGGGPYALALLASACSSTTNEESANRTATLVSVALVGAVCLSAGTDNMKENLVQMTELVEKVESNSTMASWQLWAMAKSMGPVYRYLVPNLPDSWIRKLIAYGNHDSAPADKEWIETNEEKLLGLLQIFPTMVAQGGVPGIVDDVNICLAKHHFYEEILSKVCDEASKNDKHQHLPSIGIFHGTEDRNVPITHAHYLYDNIFDKHCAKLVKFDGMGHESMIMGKANDYATFVTTSTTRQ